MNYFLTEKGLMPINGTPEELMRYMNDDYYGAINPTDPVDFLEKFKDVIDHPNILFKDVATWITDIDHVYAGKVLDNSSIAVTSSLCEIADHAALQGITLLVTTMNNVPANKSGIGFKLRCIDSNDVNHLMRSVNIDNLLENL